MKRIAAALLALFCLSLMTPVAWARPADEIQSKVTDSFVFASDQSGSMMQKHRSTGVRKIEMARRVMSRINAKIPALAYNGALCLLAPTTTVLPPAVWERAQWRQAINDLPGEATIYGRMTHMGKSLAALLPVLTHLQGKKALILFTDGCDNTGFDTHEALQELYAAQPQMLVHVVSLADTPACQARLKELADINPAAVFADARDIINTEEAAQEFVRRVFYDGIPTQSLLSLHEILFASASAEILPQYARQLDELAQIMRNKPELKVFIEGFADPAGDAASNLALSQQRATAVKDYLRAKGVKDAMLIAKGRGATDRYPSYALDRRVDIMLITQ